MGNHLNFVSEGHQVVFPSYSRALDYELEIGAVIARPVKAKHFANAISQTVVSADEVLPHLDNLKGRAGVPWKTADG